MSYNAPNGRLQINNIQHKNAFLTLRTIDRLIIIIVVILLLQL